MDRRAAAWGRAGLAAMLLVIALLVRPAAAGEGWVPLELTVGGQVQRIGTGFRHDWPGVYARAGFAGDEVAVGFDDAEGRYMLGIDDQAMQLVDRPGRVLRVFDRLGDGRHTLTLAKLSESAGPAQVTGVFVPGAAAVRAPPPRARQIELIGDSDLVGYGVEAAGRDCSAAMVRATTNTQVAYGALVAAAFGADYRVIARSGIGLLRGFDAGGSMIESYDRPVRGGSAAPPDPGWMPQVVVVALGSNDLDTPLRPGEPFTDAAALETAVTEAMLGFAARLRARYPRAWLLLAAVAGEGAWPRVTAAAAAALQAAGDRRAAFVRLPPLSRQGCHWHPSRADQAAMAQALVAAITGLRDPWQGR